MCLSLNLKLLTMGKLIFAVVFLALAIKSTVFATPLAPQPVVAGQWVKSWLLCGPIPLKFWNDPVKAWGHIQGFTDDYLLSLGGEANLKVKDGALVKLKKGTLKWSSYSTPDSIVDLRKILSRESPLCAYAYTEVIADEDKVWTVAMGTNDGSRLWVNNVLVWDYKVKRPVLPDEDLIPVVLKKGINKILLKIEQHGNAWGYCFRFLPFKSSQLTAKGDLFTVTSDEKGETRLASALSDLVLSQLIKNLKLGIVNDREKTVLEENRTTDYLKSFQVDASAFKPFTAKIEYALSTGEKFAQQTHFTVGKRVEYSLFSNGKTNYRISVDPQASESEQWAAKELQHWLKEISKADFVIQNFDPMYRGAQIVIGYNETMAKQANLAAPEETDETYRYCNIGENIYIAGGKQRGTMYGVLSFLENELGCRWYTPSFSSIPSRDALTFTWYSHSEAPGLRVRNDFYYEAFDPIWAAHNKVNGAMGYRVQPGGVESYWSVHTFFQLMPPAELFTKYPEYYSYIEGKRVADHAQLCLSNPAVLEMMIDRIKKRMRESPEYLIYDVSQNDWHNPCQCANCLFIANQYGGESGILIWFVNQVADAVKQEFPTKYIGTLSYQYTRKPPVNIKPKDNVVVRFCSIECCFSHDFKSCKENKTFLADLEGWSSLAPHLYIWDYVVNFNHYLMPYPNFSVLQPNIQTFRDNHTIGIMEQAAYQSRGGEFAELRAYLISKLLWNPDCNAEAVINDFMSGYYGRSGKFIRKYFDQLQALVTKDVHIHCLSTEEKHFTDAFIHSCLEIFAQAELVADNPEILRHVEMASVPILYLKCKQTPALAKVDGTYAKFCKITEREKITHYSESGEPHRLSFHRAIEEQKP